MKNNRIIITGDSRRGKSSLAKKLSGKLNVEFYSTDDFLWKKKFSEMEDKKLAEKNIGEIYKKDEWIVEGASIRMLKNGFETADVIIHLGFSNIFCQYLVLFRRSLRRKENLISFYKFIRHATFERYKLGYKKRCLTMLETLEPYKHKVIKLSSYKEIDSFDI